MSNSKCYTDKMWQLLNDGEWHSYHSVVHEIAKLVPPGQATRITECARLSSAGAPAHRVRPLSVDAQVWSGQKRYAGRLIRRVVRQGRVEVDREVTPQVWRERDLKIRWPGAHLVAAWELLGQLGYSPRVGRRIVAVIRATSTQHPEVTETAAGMFLRRKDIHEWAAWVIREHAPAWGPRLVWAPLDRTHDGLWNLVEARWEHGDDGIARRTVPPRGLAFDDTGLGAEHQEADDEEVLDEGVLDEADVEGLDEDL